MCGSKHNANWTTSRPSLPCSYSLLSNVLALFPHYTRPIKKKKKKKLDDVGVGGLWFSECVHIFACECMHSLCVFLGGSDVQSTSPESRTSLSPALPPSPHPGFVLVQNKTYSWQRRLDMRAHLRNAPAVLYSAPCTSQRGGLVGGSHFCHHRRGMGSSNRTSSVRINRLPVGITFPQWAVSFQTHCVDSVVSN